MRRKTLGTLVLSALMITAFATTTWADEPRTGFSDGEKQTAEGTTGTNLHPDNTPGVPDAPRERKSTRTTRKGKKPHRKATKKVETKTETETTTESR